MSGNQVPRCLTNILYDLVPIILLSPRRLKRAEKTVRQPEEGLPHADEIMERGVVLPMSHALDDEAIGFVIDRVRAFLATR